MSTYEQIDEFPGRGKSIRKFQKKLKSKLERLQGKNYLQRYKLTGEEQQKFKSPMKHWTM
jgi:hypothetical protein